MRRVIGRIVKMVDLEYERVVVRAPLVRDPCDKPHKKRDGCNLKGRAGQQPMESGWRVMGAVTRRPLVSENRVSCAYGHESSELVSWQRDHLEVSVAGTACCAGFVKSQLYRRVAKGNGKQ